MTSKSLEMEVVVLCYGLVKEWSKNKVVWRWIERDMERGGGIYMYISDIHIYLLVFCSKSPTLIKGGEGLLI